MQNIWIRVARTRFCNCTSCIHHTKATLSRRATTPTTLAAARSQLKGHLLTLGYTSTLATAAVLDMHAKKERRDQWDRLIREAKGEDPEALQEASGTTGVQDDVPVEDTAHPNDTSPRPKRMERLVRKIWTLPPLRHQHYWNIPSPDYEASLDEQLELLNHFVDHAISKTDTKFVRINNGKLKPFLRHTVMSENGEAIVFDRKNLERRPKTPLHIERLQDTFSRLVVNLLMAYKSTKSTHSSKDPVDEERKAVLQAEMQEKISSLSSENTVLPSYNLVTDEETNAGLRGLNKALCSVFEASKRGSDMVLIEICYKMIISPIAPNITTYNILIMNFLKRGLFDLSQVVIDSFFHDCMFCPNEETIAAILHHHIARNDRQAFRGMIEKMRGMNGGLRIKRQKIADLYLDSVYHWASTSKVIHRNGYLHEKAPRDQIVFHKLLLGTCIWQAAQRAVMFTRAMVREGYHLTSPILQMLVRAIIRKDELWPARRLLQFILKVWTWDQGTDDYDAKILPVSADARFVIRELMSFCGIELARDMRIKKFMGWLFIPEDRDALCRMARGLYVESLEDEVERLEVYTMGLFRRLAPYMYRRDPLSTESIAAQLEVDLDEQWSSKSCMWCLRSAHSFLSKRLETEKQKESQLLLRDRMEAALVKRAYEIARDDWGDKEYRKKRRWIMDESELDKDGNLLPEKSVEDNMGDWLDKKIKSKRGWFLGPKEVDRGFRRGWFTGPPTGMTVPEDGQPFPEKLADADEAQNLWVDELQEDRSTKSEPLKNEPEISVVEYPHLDEAMVDEYQSSTSKDDQPLPDKSADANEAQNLGIDEMPEEKRKGGYSMNEPEINVVEQPSPDESLVDERQSSMPVHLMERLSSKTNLPRDHINPTASNRNPSSTADDEACIVEHAENSTKGQGTPRNLITQYYTRQAIPPRARKFKDRDRVKCVDIQSEATPKNVISQSYLRPTSWRIEGRLEYEKPVESSTSLTKDKVGEEGTSSDLISKYYARPTRRRMRERMGYEMSLTYVPSAKVFRYFADTTLSQLKSRVLKESRHHRLMCCMEETEAELKPMASPAPHLTVVAAG